MVKTEIMPGSDLLVQGIWDEVFRQLICIRTGHCARRMVVADGKWNKIR